MIDYRDARVADAPALARLGGETFTQTFGHLYSPENLDLFLANHSAEAWAAELGNPAFSVRVAETDGALIGYAKLGPPQLPFTPSGVPAELRQLYVLAPWHGAGVAQALTGWVLDTARARGADELFLSVFTDSLRARKFYERLGFTAVGTYHFMVGNHADEDIVMRLGL